MENFENPGRERPNRLNYPSSEKAPFPEFADPVKAAKGFSELFNKVVKNVRERLPI